MRPHATKRRYKIRSSITVSGRSVCLPHLVARQIMAYHCIRRGCKSCSTGGCMRGVPLQEAAACSAVKAACVLCTGGGLLRVLRGAAGGLGRPRAAGVQRRGARGRAPGPQRAAPRALLGHRRRHGLRRLRGARPLLPSCMQPNPACSTHAPNTWFLAGAFPSCISTYIISTHLLVSKQTCLCCPHL